MAAPQIKVVERADAWNDDNLREVIRRTASSASATKGKGIDVPPPVDIIDTDSPLPRIESEDEADSDLEKQFEGDYAKNPESFDTPVPESTDEKKRRRIRNAGITKTDLEFIAANVYGMVARELGLEADGRTLDDIMTASFLKLEGEIAADTSALRAKGNNLAAKVKMMEDEMRGVKQQLTGMEASLREMQKTIGENYAAITSALTTANEYHEILKLKLDAEAGDTTSLASAVRKTAVTAVSLNASIPAPTAISSASLGFFVPAINKKKF